MKCAIAPSYFGFISRSKSDRFSEKDGWSVCYTKVCTFNNICSNYKLALPDEGTSLYVAYFQIAQPVYKVIYFEKN